MIFGGFGGTADYAFCFGVFFAEEIGDFDDHFCEGKDGEGGGEEGEEDPLQRIRTRISQGGGRREKARG